MTPTQQSEATLGRPDDDLALVLKRFRQVFTAVRWHFQQVEKQVGIGGAQVWALSVIAAQPGIGVTSLARAMHVHQSTASNLVRGLAERDLISHERETKDRRVVQLRLLPAGQELLDRAPQPHAGILLLGLSRLEADALVRLERDLASLLQAMGVADDAPAALLTQL